MNSIFNDSCPASELDNLHIYMGKERIAIKKYIYALTYVGKITDSVRILNLSVY